MVGAGCVGLGATVVVGGTGCGNAFVGLNVGVLVGNFVVACTEGDAGSSVCLLVGLGVGKDVGFGVFGASEG